MLPFTLMLTQRMKLISCWFAIVPDMPDQVFSTAQSVSSLLLHHPCAERWGMEMLPALALPVMSLSFLSLKPAAG